MVGPGGLVTAGHARPRVRDYTEPEDSALVVGANELGISPREVRELLGTETDDIPLNETTYWSNVPRNIWEYQVGGYQVLKKWLGYREARLLGRPLTSDEAREAMNIVRRLGALLLLQPVLDENYRACAAGSFQLANPRD